MYDNDEFRQRMISEIQTLPDPPVPKVFVSNKWHSMALPQDISERWQVGLKQATQTIKVTTQHGVRSALLPMARRYKAD